MNRTLVALLGLIATAVLGLAFFVYQARLTAPVEIKLQKPESVQTPVTETAARDDGAGLSLRLSTTLAEAPTTRPAPKLSSPPPVSLPAPGLSIGGARLSPPVLFSGLFLLLSGLLGAWITWNLAGRAGPVPSYADESHSELGGRLSAQEAVIDVLREELDTWRTTAGELRAAHDKQSHTIEQLRDELAAAPTVVEMPEPQLDRIDELEETLKTFTDQEERLEQWQSTVATLQSEVRGKSTLIDQLHDHITAAQEREVAAQVRLAGLDEAHTSIAELERQNEFFNDEVNQLRELADNLRRESEEKAGKLGDALVSVESLEAEKQILTDKVGELEAERETARTATQALAELERDFADAQAEGAHARAELEQRQQEIADLEQTNAEDAQRVAELEDLLNSGRRRCAANSEMCAETWKASGSNSTARAPILKKPGQPWRAVRMSFRSVITQSQR